MIVIHFHCANLKC